VIVDEPTLLAAFLQEALPTIERLVTRALRGGRAISELAIDLERLEDGKVQGGCAPREAVVQRWLTHPDVAAMKKMEIASHVRETPDDAVPVVLTLFVKGRAIFGVQRLEGDVIAPKKPN
jgi:hypothetical protein